MLSSNVQIISFSHKTQSTLKMIQKLGLKQSYRENESFKEFCGKLDWLVT